MLPESLALRFRTRSSRPLSALDLPKEVLARLPCGDCTELRIRATVSPRVLRIEDEEERFAMSWDPGTGAQLVVDHRATGYALVPNTREVSMPGEREAFLQAAYEAGQEVLEVAGSPVRTRGHHLEFGRFSVQISTVPSTGSHEEAVRQLWRWLLPGAATQTRGLGLPYRIRIMDPEEPDAELAVLETTSIEPCETAAPELTPPEGYTDLHLDREELVRLTQGLDGKARASDVRARRLFDDVLTRVRSTEAGLRRSRQALSASGLDFAWAAREPFLDQLRDLVNEVSRTMGSFHGGGENEPMHVVVDWWEQIEPELDFGEHHDQVLEGLKVLLLYRKVAAGEDLITEDEHEEGLTQDEQALYQQVLADAATRNHDLIPEEGWRASLFRDQLGSRSLELAEAEFDDLTAPRRLDFGPARLSLDDVAGMVDFEAWNFNTELRIDHADVIRELSFRDGSVRAVVDLDRIKTSFRFKTTPANTVGSVVCNLLTAGLCGWLLQLNYGWGWFTMKDMELVFDAEPQPDGAGFRWTVNLDRQSSTLNTNLFLVGVNPIQDLILLIYSAVASLFDLQSEDVLDALEDALDEEAVDSSLLNWLAIWNASRPPPGTARQIALQTGHGVWEGELEHPDGLSAFASPVDVDLMDELGYVFSSRYLTAWLREITGMPASATNLDPAVILSELDVSLPSLDDLLDTDDDGRDGSFAGPLPYPGCDSPPPTSDAQRRNRFSLRRGRPRVVLPETQQPLTTDHAGRVEVVYDIVLRAVEQRDLYVPHVMPPVCRRVHPGGLPGGGPVGPDPRPPMDRTPLRGDLIRTLEHQARTTPKTPGERQRLERAIDHLYRGDGGTSASGSPTPMGHTPGHPPGEGPTTPPGGIPVPGGDPPPGGGIPGGPPGGGGVPGGWPEPSDPWNLPEEICEPPHCEWKQIVRETPLREYLRARVRVAGELLVGFDPNGAYWLPQIVLRMKRTREDEPELHAHIEHLSRDAPFDQIPEDTLKETLKSFALEDAANLFAAAAADPEPRARRELVPPEARCLFLLIAQDLEWETEEREAAWEEIHNSVVFEQDGGPSDLEYVVFRDRVHWPFAFQQRFSQWLA